MLENVDMPAVGGFIMLISMLLSGVVTWFFLRRAKSSQRQHFTKWEKYISPLLTLAFTNIITFLGIVLMLIPNAAPQMTYKDWIVAATIPVACTGSLFLGLIFSYLINLWWHERSFKSN